jgi:hypothetical protein
MTLLTYARRQWDRVGAWVAIAAGSLVLLLGYLGISGTPHVAEQLPYIISGGLFGIFLLGVGGMLWVSADLRDEWREVHAIRDALERANLGAAEVGSHVAPDLVPPDVAVSAAPTKNGSSPRRRSPARTGRPAAPELAPDIKGSAAPAKAGSTPRRRTARVSR